MCIPKRTLFPTQTTSTPTPASPAAIDILGTPSALLLALLAQVGEQVRYASGRVVAAISAAYAGAGKTDAEDAYVIAETARIRTDLAVVDTDTDLVRALGVLTGHRTDLVADGSG